MNNRRLGGRKVANKRKGILSRFSRKMVISNCFCPDCGTVLAKSRLGKYWCYSDHHENPTKFDEKEVTAMKIYR
jgi:hypothetical protein